MVEYAGQNTMPDIPPMDVIDAISEIWSVLNFAAYHLAYVRTYTNTMALQTDVDEIRKLEHPKRELLQEDLLICRAHLAAFFWQIDHILEALRIAIRRGQKEHPEAKYFWTWEKELDKLEQTDIWKQINGYRNKAHEIPAIIGCKWESKGGKFVGHFLPGLVGQKQDESLCLNDQLVIVRAWRSESEIPARFQIQRDGAQHIPCRITGRIGGRSATAGIDPS